MRTLYFLYDYERYLAGNGVNIDLYAEMPGCVFQEVEELIGVLEGEWTRYPKQALLEYGDAAPCTGCRLPGLN